MLVKILALAAIGFISIILVDSIVGYKYENIFECIGIFGKPGGGKTMLLTKEADYHVNRKWKVFADFPCHIEGVTRFNDELFKSGQWLPDGRNDSMQWEPELNALGKPRKIKQKICLIIDEIGTLYNNRDFKTNFSKETLKWWKEHRHAGVKIIYASQAYNDMDKKLRVLTDRYYLLKKPFFKLIRYAKLVQVETDISNENKDTGGQIIDLYKYSFFTQWKFLWLPKWVKKFNSYA